MTQFHNALNSKPKIIKKKSWDIPFKICSSSTSSTCQKSGVLFFFIMLKINLFFLLILGACLALAQEAVKKTTAKVAAGASDAKANEGKGKIKNKKFPMNVNK